MPGARTWWRPRAGCVAARRGSIALWGWPPQRSRVGLQNSHSRTAASSTAAGTVDLGSPWRPPRAGREHVVLATVDIAVDRPPFCAEGRGSVFLQKKEKKKSEREKEKERNAHKTHWRNIKRRRRRRDTEKRECAGGGETGQLERVSWKRCGSRRKRRRNQLHTVW